MSQQGNSRAFSGGMMFVGALLQFVPGIGQMIGVGLIASGFASLAASALMPKPLGSGGFNSSATYGFDRSSNAAFEGAPRFFVLGEERIAPTYVSVNTTWEGNHAYLNALMFCGTGGDYGIESITDIEINGEPIENFEEVTTLARYGTATQTLIPGFNAVGTSYDRDTDLKKDVTTTYESRDVVDEMRLMLTWRGGIYHQTKTGIESTEQTFTVKGRRKKSDGTWTEWKRFKVNAAGSQIHYKINTMPHDLHGPGPEWQPDEKYWRIKGNTTGTFRAVIRLDFRGKAASDTWSADAAVSEFSIKAHEGNNEKTRRKATLTRVEEILYDSTLTYAGDSLLAIKAMASNKLGETFPRITCTVRGWKVLDPRTNTVAWTRNPVLLTRAFLLNEKDGCGEWITSADLWDGSGEDWRTVADRCDAVAASSGPHKEPRWQLDLVVDNFQDARSWLTHICGTFRAGLIEYGGKIGIRQDVASASIRTYDGRKSPTAGTRPILMIDDGRADIVVSELKTDQRANIVRAYYRDRNGSYYRRQTDEIKDTARLSAGDPEVRKEIPGQGITRMTQAVRESRFTLNRDRLSYKRVSLGVGIGDLDHLPMDVITVYADSPQGFENGVTLLVEGVSYDNESFLGRLQCRWYNAGVYADTTGTLSTADSFLPYAQAVSITKRRASGAYNVIMTEEN